MYQIKVKYFALSEWIICVTIFPTTGNNKKMHSIISEINGTVQLEMGKTWN
jgi:hypothetical protein